MFRTRLLHLAFAACLAACGSTDAPPPSESATESQSESLYGEDADTPGVRFDVTVKSGEHAGDYELVSYDPRPCQIGMSGEDMFGVNASGRPPQLIYAQAFVSDFQDGGGETDAFSVTAKGADFEYRIDTQPSSMLPGGQGTATYTDDGENSIRVEIRGETEDGVALEAVVECYRVGR